MSTIAVANPCDRLPMRMISPLRTYQVTPLASRNRVIRRVTSSTVPIASPVSITSPTPYWSSMIMNTPARKSLTRLCAPKPSATPATPADASSGASGMPSRAMIVSTAMVTTTKVTVLRRLRGHRRDDPLDQPAQQPEADRREDDDGEDPQPDGGQPDLRLVPGQA